VPLYPQYSTSTSASSLEDFARQVPDGIDYLVLDRHFDNDGLHLALLEGINRLLEMPERPPKTAVLFTAHSIPTSYTASGDPYVAEVEATAAALQRALGDEVPTSLAFQSAVKFGTWHGPTVDELLPLLREQGVEGLIVQPLTFVSENLETLYDLDIVLRQKAQEAGFTWFERGPAPGTNPAYVAGLAEAIGRRVAAGRDEDA
jgi:ferrochelatase